MRPFDICGPIIDDATSERLTLFSVPCGYYWLGDMGTASPMFAWSDEGIDDAFAWLDGLA